MPGYGAPGIGANMGYPGTNVGYGNAAYANPAMGNLGIGSPATMITNAS
jgi:hypothetical protein